MERLFTLFTGKGCELYLVGGAVRDLCLGKTLPDLTDLDFATDAGVDRMTNLLKEAGYPVYTVGSRYGTIGTLLEGEGRRYDVQITTYRSDEYTPGSRKPTVTFSPCLEEDLLRRDFTINAMALGPDGVLVDRWGGREDLASGRLRTVRDAETTFQEDPLRMLRAARFIATLNLHPADSLTVMAASQASSILAVSRERWFQEMQKLLTGSAVGAGMRFLHHTDLLSHILPELHAVAECQDSQGPYHDRSLWEHTMAVVQGTPPIPALRWAGLLHDVGKLHTRTVNETGRVRFLGHAEASGPAVDAVAERFRFDRDLHTRVRYLVLNHLKPVHYSPNWTNGAVRRFAHETGDYLEDLLALSEADVQAHAPAARNATTPRLMHLRARIQCVAQTVTTSPLLPKGIGEAIMRHFNLAPGPRIGHLKTVLERAVLDGLLPQGGDVTPYLVYLDRNP